MHSFLRKFDPSLTTDLHCPGIRGLQCQEISSTRIEKEKDYKRRNTTVLVSLKRISESGPLRIRLHKPWLSRKFFSDSFRLVQPGLPNVVRSSAARSFWTFERSRILSSQKSPTNLWSGLSALRCLKTSLTPVRTRFMMQVIDVTYFQLKGSEKAKIRSFLTV